MTYRKFDDEMMTSPSL